MNIEPKTNKRTTKTTATTWPRNNVKFVETRKRDLVLRITNWMDDRDEPAYDVECYINGVYDWNESKSFTMFSLKGKSECKRQAIAFAKQQVEKLLK